MRAPSSYLVREHLAVTADVAPMIRALLADSRRRMARGDFGAPDERLSVWLADLDRIVADRSASDTSPAATMNEMDRYLSTAEAAARLGISDRAVRDLRLERRKVVGNWRWLESDVDAEVEARRQVLRNPPEGCGAAASRRMRR